MLSNVQSSEISAGNESTQLLVSQHAVASFAPRRAQHRGYVPFVVGGTSSE